MITPATYTEDAINQLNQQGVDVVKPVVLYQQRNFARRHFAGEAPWGWAKKPTTLTLAADGTFTTLYSASLTALGFTPDYRHQPDVFQVISGRPVEWTPDEFMGLFDTADTSARFWVDENAGKIYSNTSGFTYAVFQKQIVDLPNDTSQDTVAEPFPDGTAVTFLLASFYALATRQELETSAYFRDQYDAWVALESNRQQGKVAWRPLDLPVTARR